MAIKPSNLTPDKGSDVMAPSPTEQPRRYGNLINPPFTPQFGGAMAVSKVVKRAPYGRIAHVGKRGTP